MKNVSNHVLLMCGVLFIAGCPKKDDAATSAEGGAPSSPATGVTGAVAKGLSLLGAGPFSGEIDLTIKNDKGAGKGSIMVKGTKQRLEFTLPDQASRSMSMIVDGDQKKMIALDDAKKTAMIMNLDEAGKPTGTASGVTVGQGAAPKEKDFKKTGKTDTVAGYTCEIWTYEEDDGKGELCVADGLTVMGLSRLGGIASALGSNKITGFPLRVITQAKDGKEKERMEVTKLERKDIADDKFQVPPGYKTMNMEDLMKGLGGIPRH